jgi:3-hydroxyacyl-[acyl-carrier-protein] dehydratase
MFPAVTDLIPHRPPFLFVDQIVSAGTDFLVAEHTWRREEAFYAGHYPGAPITPGVLLCEAVVQTGALLVALGQSGAGVPPGMPILVKINDVRFRLPVYPGETTVMEVKKTQSTAGFGMFAGTMRRGGKRILNLEFTVTMKDAAETGAVSPPP